MSLFPCTAPQVCARDRVVVDLHNMQLSDSESLHFHGQAMADQQYYDGVPYITQCPVLAGTFRYNFITGTAGSQLWHSHVGLHRGSGVFGALVIREAEDPLRHLYDTDLPEHVVVVSDWNHVDINTFFWDTHHRGAFIFPRNILFNGKGRDPTTGVLLPLEVVHVKPGARHRMRFINGGSLDCPVVLSVDAHRLTIIAMDGTAIEPFTTDSFVMFSGERFDVILEANQTVDNYWIRNDGLVMCGFDDAMQGAILRYEGAPEEDPTPTLTYDPNPQGVMVNPARPNPDSPNIVSCVDLDSLEPSHLDEKPDKKFYLAFNFRAVNNTAFFNPKYYPFNGVSHQFQTVTPQVNNISFKYPVSPLLSQPEAPQPTMCLYGEDPPCDGDFCSCTYTLEVGLGETVEIVLIDEGDFVNSSHPFHLHGHNFNVIAMERLGDKTTQAEVIALDDKGGIKRRLDNTIMKDTINIPHGGYTVIRFTADNPGWWAMHCHLVDHAEMGMVAVLHVGTQKHIPPIPEGFPKCGNFKPDVFS